MQLLRLYAAIVCAAAMLGLRSPTACSEETPLIPRADLFGNPVKAFSNISPDGKWLSWLAPFNGTLNL